MSATDLFAEAARAQREAEAAKDQADRALIIGRKLHEADGEIMDRLTGSRHLTDQIYVAVRDPSHTPSVKVTIHVYENGLALTPIPTETELKIPIPMTPERDYEIQAIRTSDGAFSNMLKIHYRRDILVEGENTFPLKFRF